MDQIEEIRSKIDIVQYISEFLPLTKAGRNFKGLCPFHSEKTPSFIVSPERQIWKCFGCSAGGDVFGFLMQVERIEFGEALRILAKKTGVLLQGYQPTKGESEKDKLYQINHLSSEFFHYLLLNHSVGKKALNYILQRGISKESLEKFKIGYSPPMWEGLQKFLVGKKGYKVEDLEKAGLVVSRQASTNHQPLTTNHYYDRFRDRLMFPLSDHRGNIVGFSGRLLDPNTNEAKYVNTPETIIYHKSDLLYPLQVTKEDIKKENSAVVVEGELDAISSYQVGVKNMVAIKGSALTEPQLRLLKRFAENLVLSLDTDSAGDMASRRGIEMADKIGFNIKVAILEKYKDPDEAAQKDPEYLKKRIAKAENIYDFYIDSSFKRLRGVTAEEKKKIGTEITPILAKIDDEIVKNVYIKKLADRLKVSEEAVILQIERYLGRNQPVGKTLAVLPPPKLKGDVLEEYYLALLFQSKKVERLLDKNRKLLLKNPGNLKLVGYLKDYFEEKKKFSAQFFFKVLPAEVREIFDKLYLVDFGSSIENDEWVENETKKAEKRLQLLRIKEELQDVCNFFKSEKCRLKKEEERKTQEKIRNLTQKLSVLEKEV